MNDQGRNEVAGPEGGSTIMPAKPAKSRPAVITVICVLMAIGAVFAIPVAMSDAARAVGSWYPPLLLVMSVIGVVCLVGFWRMKRWAPILYAAATAVVQVALLSTGNWTPSALLVPLVVILLSFSQFSNME